MYFCEIHNNTIRLSVEASQIIGPQATKNIVELNEEDQTWQTPESIKKQGFLKTGKFIVEFLTLFSRLEKYPKEAQELIGEFKR